MPNQAEPRSQTRVPAWYSDMLYPLGSAGPVAFSMMSYPYCTSGAEGMYSGWPGGQCGFIRGLCQLVGPLNQTPGHMLPLLVFA